MAAVIRLAEFESRTDMRVEEFLQRLEAVRSGPRGWTARCPGHNDRTPSLRISEGDDARILLHCFAGCAEKDICGVLGLQLRDLFPAPARSHGAIKPQQARPRRFDWRLRESKFRDHAESLWVNAESILRAAREINTSTWSACDF